MIVTGMGEGGDEGKSQGKRKKGRFGSFRAPEFDVSRSKFKVSGMGYWIFNR
jgi:hypothetical protein